MDKEIMEQLLAETLQKMGKSRADFDKEVEEIKKESSVEIMGNLMSIILESMDATANMLSLVIIQNAQLKKDIQELKGGSTNG